MAVGDYAIYVAIGAVLITAIGIFISDRSTRKSNELTKYELKHRMRAWVSIKNVRFHAIAVDGKIVYWDDYWNNPSKFTKKPTRVMLKTEITNVGSMPAENVIILSLKETTPIQRKGSGSLKSNPHPLLPEDELPFIFEYSYDEYDKAGKTPLYMGIKADYQVDGKPKGIGKIWSFDGFIVNRDSWIEENESKS